MELFVSQATEDGSRDGSAFMKPQISPLTLITSYMFAIEVLVLLKS